MGSHERARAAADRINEKISIVDVLAAYGYRVREAGGREQQFSCDLHGDGRDNTPSARVYPDSNSWYCFACDKTRDAIETVREKEGLDFWKAVKFLEKHLGLDPLPFEYERKSDVAADVRQALDPTRTFDDDMQRVSRFLDTVTHDRSLPLPSLLQFWEAFDKVVFMVQGTQGDNGVMSQAKGRALLLGLLKRVQQAEKDAVKA